ncbi:uncharacterized protein KD926_000658 [Aspergillus affinis]|uniref:uncharacterized protein n=1 Tax=Aspergillus affinis TaxID=1070780 RepID=UPI0022FE06E7|nr:uncharacterized protein KD926_000658 [Aspergillus affinis]KAI9037296.1 hypothetical protein KD926_000658 [Aspergillus affinis]
MLRHAKRLQSVLNKVCSQYENYELQPSQEEWRQIDYLLSITQPFFTFTTSLSKTKEVTIYSVFAIYNNLFTHLEKSKAQLARKKVGWKKVMLSALRAAKLKLSEYYRMTDEIGNDLYAIGTILAPQNKFEFFPNKDWEPNWRMRYRKSLEEYLVPYQQRYSELQPTSNSQFSVGEISDGDILLISASSLRPQMTAYDELSQYLESSMQVVNPRTYWKDHQHEFPILASLARDILTTPASGSCVERLFNSARNICHYRRDSLKPETIRDLMIISTREAEAAREEKEIRKTEDEFDPISDTEEDSLVTISQLAEPVSQRALGKIPRVEAAKEDPGPSIESNEDDGISLPDNTHIQGESSTQRRSTRVMLSPQKETTKPIETPSPPSGNSPDRLLKARIPFLLRYYDANNTVLDLIPALEAGRPKAVHSSNLSSHSGETASGQLNVTEGFLEEPGFEEPPFMWNSSIELNNYVIAQRAENVPTNHQEGDILSLRAQELAQNLKPFATCTKSQANLKNAVDQGLFSATNIRLFEHLYVQHHHRHCPIIYFPTFQAESATLPLLLATFLGGSLHSYPRDTCSLAVDCIDIAESYMFSLSVFNTEIQYTATYESQMSENYDILKAVVILLQLQIGRNDPDIRRRVRYQRFPMLVHAARSISLFSSRHDRGSTTSEGWVWNAQSESRLRTAHFILLLDCEFVTSFRIPPMITILESTGNLPCNELMFFQNQSSLLVKTPHSPSLVHVIDLLMDGAWDGPSNPVFSNIGVFGLFTVISGLHLVMFSAFTSRMIQQNLAPLHRALSRWKILWEELISQTSNEAEMELAGFMASANELWLVTKAIMRIDSEEYFSLFDGQSLQPFNELFPSIIDMKNQ